MATILQSRLVRNFEDQATVAVDGAELTALIENASRELDFEYFAVLHSPSLIAHSSRFIRYDNYPVDWDKRLVGRGARIVDPILAIARRRVSEFLWADALSDLHLSSAERALLADASRVGIRHGVTIPANIPGEPEGSVSFASHRKRGVTPERLMIAGAIGRIAFDAARRIAGYCLVNAPVPKLSVRVRECVYWIAHGKTDQDIADILGIGVETVRTYVKSAFRLVNVLTRAQLVHEALRLGLIDFAPSIPPYG
jgi:LuxR family quorum-sensing system transcriptional regulator CciR